MSRDTATENVICKLRMKTESAMMMLPPATIWSQLDLDNLIVRSGIDQDC